MIFIAIPLALLAGLLLYLAYQYDKSNKDRIQDLSKKVGELTNGVVTIHKDLDFWKSEALRCAAAADKQLEINSKLLSQKKSSETRLGAIAENLVPILQGLPYSPANLHHLGQPIDYIYFDYENAEIVFIEVKSGNSKESNRQRIIKNIIKAGKIYYEELRINQKGITVKRANNVD